eukprot:scaffold660407_cov61-Prasinocladus_malaysianus.AAC.1
MDGQKYYLITANDVTVSLPLLPHDVVVLQPSFACGQALIQLINVHSNDLPITYPLMLASGKDGLRVQSHGPSTTLSFP